MVINPTYYPNCNSCGLNGMLRKKNADLYILHAFEKDQILQEITDLFAKL